ncbi:MAG: hypothetical protein QOI07_1619 [Verrucomicrobiota bacterium]|jgi:hypothetical protein
MEAHKQLIGRQSEPCSTDASHSAIGRTTALDYNLASIHKNAVIVVNKTVAVRPIIGLPDSSPGDLA